ncbi:hypothetical protein BSLG_001215 [Batrachochytrium salamandrivorans]|nr:hypothetical protein BSLG_001215 [Batrachochytrium salamandrivorans]
MFASRAALLLQPTIARVAASHGLAGASIIRCSSALVLHNTLCAQLRLSSSTSSAGTGPAMAKRLESLGEDANKPTLDIDPFAKSLRLRRPVAPHLTIYQPQITWILSGVFRISSAGLAAGFYGVALAYAAIPISSLEIAALVHSLPPIALILGKFILAAPIAFHLFNGMRHLASSYAMHYSIMMMIILG